MSEGINEVRLLGNLGADPELRRHGERTVLNMRLGTTETYVDDTGVRQNRTEWHNCALWGKRAEPLSKYLKKGSRIHVSGSLRTRKYEKDGTTKYSTDVIVTDVVFAGGLGDKQSKPEAPPTVESDYTPEQIPF